MSVPCKQCGCGRINDISVAVCACGQDMSEIEDIIFVQETEAGNNTGEIDFERDYFVLTCPKCKTTYYLAEESDAPKKCLKPGCGRLLNRTPVQKLQCEENVQTDEEEIISSESHEEVETFSDWGDIFGSTLTLKSIGFGNFTAALSSDDIKQPFMIGRDAGYADFLSYDERVSRRHCELWYENSRWFVKDNHSSNGISINDVVLDEDAQSELRDGDILKLGHHPDSISFRITIE